MLLLLLALSGPYFASHQTNAVKWSPWGAEAFARAKKENKPVFLSIGYASCHWCHVMSRESFDDPEIGKLLNANFVPVLLDREEHPDVDAIYIAYIEETTGSAGWPANLVLDANQQPLAGATYMQPDALKRWLAAVVSNHPLPPPVPPSTIGNAAASDAIARAVDQLQQSFDAKNGGFSGAPKFPLPSTIDFLLRSGGPLGRDMAFKTLRAMANGSIHDQIGGGFHRYTTDAAWRDPHYEKMLTDQALLAIDYLEAWQLTRDPQFESVARDTLDYILDMRMPGAGGGFASSQNADSLIAGKSGPELVEGAFYFWSPEQLAFLRDDAKIAARYYGIDKPGSLPYVADPFTDISAIRARMKELRSKRPQPALDMKVIAGWNGLAISALARGGAAFGEKRYIDGANEAAKVIRAKLWKTKLSRVEGVDALCEDYAFAIGGMLDLFEATGDPSLLEFAVTLQNKQDALFWNESASRYENGGSAPKPLQGWAVESESAIPTANSVSAANLLRLGEFTDSAAWRDRARSIFRGYGWFLERQPSEFPAMVAAMTMTLAAPRQIVIAGNPSNPDTKTMLRIAHERFFPFRIIVPLTGDVARQRLAVYMPVVKEMKPLEKKATAYVCEHYVCKLPTSDPVQLTKTLESP